MDDSELRRGRVGSGSAKMSNLLDGGGPGRFDPGGPLGREGPATEYGGG
jgi:hypothetical protein